MFRVQVYHEKQDVLYNVMLLRHDNFAQLKEKVFSRYAEAEYAETQFSLFSLEMASSFTKQKKRNNHTPHESDNVYDVIMRAESSFFGRILLRLVDLRGDNSMASDGQYTANELWSAAVAATSDKYDLWDSGSCTSWATTGYNSLGDGISGGEMLIDAGAAAPSSGSIDTQDIPRLFSEPSILDSMFAELSSMALVQGRLHKKISNHRRQDIWREQYFILDGRMNRLWFFPITADHVGNGTVNHNSGSARDLGMSGLGVPSYIPLMCSANTMAQQSVLVSTHKSDPTCFTITITDEWAINASVADRVTSEHRVVSLRAPTADKAAKWVSRLSSLHIMLQQPLLAPGPENKRLYNPIMSKFLAKYGDGSCTYTAAVQDVLGKHTVEVQVAAGNFHSAASTTLRACGGGGTVSASSDSAEETVAIPVTARAASHWAANCMLESIEDCVAVTQLGNSDRDVDTVENLMTFEGMLKNKYLRGYFQKYLTNNCTEETLLFWEYAEDFWRAHPFSPHSFALASSSAAGGSSGVTARHSAANDILLALKQQDSVMLGTASVVRQWAESLYLTFIHPNAPYQLCCCTARDVARVGATIEQLSSTDMPPYNLFRSIQLSAFTFMKTMCYPDFLAQPNYHRILIAAIHAADRGAINANLMASCIVPDREQSTFDHSVVAVPEQPSSSQPSNGISYPAANSRGLLGMVKNMVISRRQSTGPITPTDQATSNKVDARNYAARWRTTKLVVFELVRGELDLTGTNTGTASSTTAATATSLSGSKKYRRLGKRKGSSSRSIIGDKLRKLRALQNGVVRKIGWLPEWWWDLVPHIKDLQGEGEAGQGLKGAFEEVPSSKAREEAEEALQVLDACEDSYVDDEGDFDSVSEASVADHPASGPWTCWNDCGSDWMPADMNYLKGAMERVRQQNAPPHYNAQNTLHTELLVHRLVQEEERPPNVSPAGRSASLFLPAGWKPVDFSGGDSSHKSQDPHSAVVPSKMKYSSSIPKCIGQLNVTKGRCLLEDYSHIQPASFQMKVTLAGNGMLMLCSVVRSRYVTPTVKTVGLLMRGFSKRTSNLDSRKSEAHDDLPPSNSPGRVPTGRKIALSNASIGGVPAESVCISGSPLPVLPLRNTGLPHQQPPNSRLPRTEEFAVTGSASSSAEWPRQCAALYLCMGVPRLFLIDPVTLVPSACIDLHEVRKIAPTEQYLHSIDLQDRTHCTWQISPEGIDPDDTREATRRWLLTMSALTLPSTQVVHVLKSGYLHKRGRLNRAFKLRWFVLCSDLKLRYYKDDLQGMFKGTIDLCSDQKSAEPVNTTRGSGSTLPNSQQVVRFDKEIVVTTQTQATQRAFTLLAEDVATAEDWLRTLTDLLGSPLNVSTGSSKGGAFADRSPSMQSAEALMGAHDAEDLDDADEEEDD